VKHKYKYYRVFAYGGKGGNMACVFENQGYSEETKQKFAEKINLSEIVFIFKKENKFYLQYFTPNKEIDMCGHATIAAIMYINETYGEFPNEIYTETSKIHIKYDEKRIYIDLGIAKFIKKMDNFQELSNSLAIDINYMGYEKLKPVIYKSGIADILMPVYSYEMLMKIEIDVEKLTRLSENNNVVGLHAFTIKNNQIFARNFAPLYGINEEFATGTANNSLIYLLKSENIEIKNKGSIIQGDGFNIGEIHYLYLDNKVYIGGDVIFEEDEYDLF